MNASGLYSPPSTSLPIRSPPLNSPLPILFHRPETLLSAVTEQIAAAGRHGLAAIPSICGGACANISGAWGFQIADEPSVSAFPQASG
jgi:hypothetical protein